MRDLKKALVLGGHMDIGKLSTALALSSHPISAQIIDLQEEKLIEERRKELDEQNSEFYKNFGGRIKVKDLRQQLAEITYRTKTFHEKPDRIPCPKPYRRRK